VGLSVVASIVRISKSYYGCFLTNKERKKGGMSSIGNLCIFYRKNFFGKKTSCGFLFKNHRKLNYLFLQYQHIKDDFDAPQPRLPDGAKGVGRPEQQAGAL
jgi:hypothetical protein